MSQRHATDVIALVFGVILAGATLVWLLNVSDAVHARDLWWAGPVVLVVAGIAGLVAALRPTKPTGISTMSTH